MTINLITDPALEVVHSEEAPSFKTAPGVVLWGERVFVYSYRENADTVVYRETLALTLPDKSTMVPGNVYEPPRAGALFSVRGEVWGTEQPRDLQWTCKCQQFRGTLAALIEHGIAAHAWPEGLRDFKVPGLRSYLPGDYTTHGSGAVGREPDPRD